MLEGGVSLKFNENLHPDCNIGIKYEEACPINLSFLG
jgi:hypothetical protein